MSNQNLVSHHPLSYLCFSQFRGYQRGLFMLFTVYNLQCLWYFYNLKCLWYKRLSPLKLGILLCLQFHGYQGRCSCCLLFIISNVYGIRDLSPLKLGIRLWFFFAGSWLPEPLLMLFAVYNLQCLWNKRLSPLKLGIRFPLVPMCTQYNILIKCVSDLWQVGDFPGYSGFLYQ